MASWEGCFPVFFCRVWIINKLLIAKFLIFKRERVILWRYLCVWVYVCVCNVRLHFHAQFRLSVGLVLKTAQNVLWLRAQPHKCEHLQAVAWWMLCLSSFNVLKASEHDFWSQCRGIWIPALSHFNCTALGKLFTLFEIQSHYLQNRDNHNIYS